MRVRQASVLLFAAALVAAPARAGQIVDPSTGSIVGIVRDTMGAVVPDVAITVSGAALMTARTTTTGADGTYRITGLPPGDYTLSFSRQGFTINYFDTPYPVSLSSYTILTGLLEASARGTMLPSILSNINAAAIGADYETWQAMKAEWLEAIHQDPAHMKAISDAVATLNDDPAQLENLLHQQYYVLCYWKETDRRINYRRFFTVNELICLRMENDKVFDEYHSYLNKLYKEEMIQGFRIDHIDGLHDPAKYTRDLRKLTGDSCYIIAEKILEAKEEMPSQWSVEGTSGYEFLSFLNQLLTYRKGARELLTFYEELIPGMSPYKQLIFESKKLILENYLRGEWDNLTSLFRSLRLDGNYDGTRIKHALGLFMLSLPVYRIYPDALPLKGRSLLVIHETFEKALAAGPAYTEEITYLRNMFTSPPDDEKQRDAALQFLKRLMQFTGPLTAKGVEDTTFYIYNPLISHDEVGGSPETLGMSVQRFHEKMKMRQATTPLSLNATATHDTKRGEDARVRINVLSRMPGMWGEHVSRWLEMNDCCRASMNGRTVPELNDEYFIYQSMLGGFPEDYHVTEEWVTRVQSYMNKALREAKVNTNWSEPDEEYEQGCEQFIERILDAGHGFLASFIPFVRTVCEHAMVYTLSQTLIKLTAPGVPDIYQGCELWDLSFVDPDNRRPVDYERRMQFLFQLIVREEKGRDDLFDYLRQHRDAGIEKLYLIWKTLNFRKRKPLVFVEGEYIPVAITGSEISAAAYARQKDDDWVLVAIPLGLVKHDVDAVADTVGEQFLVLPEEGPTGWFNVLTGESFEASHQISLMELFREFPVALLSGSVRGGDSSSA